MLYEEQEIFPIILVHKDLDYLQWICSINDLDEIESVLINKQTKEIKTTKLLDSQDALTLKNEFLKLGWTKGYLPDVNIISDGNIVQTIKLT